MKKETQLIIAIDGGGIRGILPLFLLRHLSNLVADNKTYDIFRNRINRFAGTSVGAIISAGLMVEKAGKKLYSIDDLLTLFQSRGPQLFNLSRPIDASSEGLRLLLKRRFLGFKLSDLPNDYVFLSFDLHTNKPFLFSSSNKELSEVSLEFALAACSAVPGYFSPIPYQQYNLVDGMLAAKNPAGYAWEEVQKHSPEIPVVLLSFGTGLLQGEWYDEIEEKTTTVHQHLEGIAKKNKNLHYFRFQPDIVAANPRMDDASSENIVALCNDATTFINSNDKMINEFLKVWNKLI